LAAGGTLVNGTPFYRPSRAIRYQHIDAMFGEPGKNVIDWTLIETHFQDLLRVAISVREGTASSTLLLRRLRSGSRKNAHYAAFREAGRGTAPGPILSCGPAACRLLWRGTDRRRRPRR
jgi:TnpA family transposase